MKKFLYLILGVILTLLLVLFFINSCSKEEQDKKTTIIRDTIIVRDTITLQNPIEKIRWKEKEKYIYIPIVDTLVIYKDSSKYIAVQEEKVQYENENFKAIVSGIYPKLEEISVYPKTVYITETKIKKKNWNFGVMVGPGVFYDYHGKINCGIGIDLGFAYNF